MRSDGASVTAPVLRDSGASNTPGISERRGSTKTFNHSGIENIDAQTGTAQTVAATRQYDAFGNTTASTGTFQGPFGNAGGFGYQEDATGLKLLGHRYYDSSTGRFITRDPIKDGRNWYVYCRNNPTRLVDPTGLISGFGGVLGASSSGNSSTIGNSGGSQGGGSFSLGGSSSSGGSFGPRRSAVGQRVVDDGGYTSFANGGPGSNGLDPGDDEANGSWFEWWVSFIHSIAYDNLHRPPAGVGGIVGIGTAILDGGDALGNGLIAVGIRKGRIQGGMEGIIHEGTDSTLADQGHIDLMDSSTDVMHRWSPGIRRR